MKDEWGRVRAVFHPAALYPLWHQALPRGDERFVVNTLVFIRRAHPKVSTMFTLQLGLPSSWKPPAACRLLAGS